MRRIAIPFFLICLFPLFLWGGVNQVSAEDGAELISIEKVLIESEKSFRKVSGLEASDEHIFNVIKEHKNEQIKEKFGAYLTDEEVKVVEKIIDINEYIPKLRQIIGESADKPSDIAAFSADYEHHKFIVYLTEGNEQARAIQREIIHTFPDREMLEFKYVQHSALELTEKSGDLKVGDLVDKSEVVSKTIDMIQNKVVVGIAPFDEKVSRTLKEEYGSLIQVIAATYEQEEARTTPLSHMQGGLQIGSTPARSTGRGYCTLGYTAKKNGVNYLVTAGHCLKNAGSRGEAYWYQGGSIVGGGAAYGENYYYDAGLIKLTSTKYATNYIYKFNSFDSKYVRETNGSAYVGQPVCISGATSGFQCGTVTNTGQEYLINNSQGGGTYTGFRTGKSYVSAGGDSGAPVWYGGVLIGIHNTTNSFSHLNAYKNSLGIQAIVNY